jgi:hypothetical protein
VKFAQTLGAESLRGWVVCHVLQFQAREARQRVRADKFQGFRNKQLKRAVKREEKQEKRARQAVEAQREARAERSNRRPATCTRHCENIVETDASQGVSL